MDILSIHEYPPASFEALHAYFEVAAAAERLARGSEFPSRVYEPAAIAGLDVVPEQALARIRSERHAEYDPSYPPPWTRVVLRRDDVYDLSMVNALLHVVDPQSLDCLAQAALSEREQYYAFLIQAGVVIQRHVIGLSEHDECCQQFRDIIKTSRRAPEVAGPSRAMNRRQQLDFRDWLALMLADALPAMAYELRRLLPSKFVSDREYGLCTHMAHGAVRRSGYSHEEGTCPEIEQLIDDTKSMSPVVKQALRQTATVAAQRMMRPEESRVGQSIEERLEAIVQRPDDYVTAELLQALEICVRDDRVDRGLVLVEYLTPRLRKDCEERRKQEWALLRQASAARRSGDDDLTAFLLRRLRGASLDYFALFDTGAIEKGICADVAWHRELARAREISDFTRCYRLPLEAADEVANWHPEEQMGMLWGLTARLMAPYLRDPAFIKTFADREILFRSPAARARFVAERFGDVLPQATLQMLRRGSHT